MAVGMIQKKHRCHYIRSSAGCRASSLSWWQLHSGLPNEARFANTLIPSDTAKAFALGVFDVAEFIVSGISKIHRIFAKCDLLTTKMGEYIMDAMVTKHRKSLCPVCE